MALPQGPAVLRLLNEKVEVAFGKVEGGDDFCKVCIVGDLGFSVRHLTDHKHLGEPLLRRP